MRLPPRKLVAGLDLARRSDHSALVLLDVEADRLTLTAALRLPQAPLRQQFALIEDEEVEPGEVRCDQRELFAQRRLRQAQRGADGEPVSLDVHEHEGAVVAAAGEIEAGDELQM